ncbi:hypothetical protein GCM10009722_31820 [Williamsia deligens]|nr:hypothetical protein [Williamsia deligens]
MILAATVVAAVAVGVAVVPRRSTTPRAGGLIRHPGLWSTAVVVVMAVNQVFVTAYVHQAWGDDTTRITQYLPPGWFDMADLGPLSDALPAWPWTVLHVQAALELPFVMLAYLLVARWFGPAVFARVMAARWWIAASWTVTFCLIEEELSNPYTTVDIVIRLVAGLATPLAVSRLVAGEKERSTGLVTIAVSAGALGVLVLAVYDVLTLYDLGHAPQWVVPVAVAGVVLAAARWHAGRVDGEMGPVTGSAARSLGWFVVLFAVPALPVRYGLNFGLAGLSIVAGVTTIVAAVWRGWDRRRGRALGVVLMTGVAGAAVGAVATSTLAEARLLGAAAGFVVVSAATCAACDRRVRRS